MSITQETQQEDHYYTNAEKIHSLVYNSVREQIPFKKIKVSAQALNDSFPEPFNGKSFDQCLRAAYEEGLHDFNPDKFPKEEVKKSSPLGKIVLLFCLIIMSAAAYIWFFTKH